MVSDMVGFHQVPSPLPDQPPDSPVAPVLELPEAEVREAEVATPSLSEATVSDGEAVSASLVAPAEVARVLPEEREPR